MCVKILPETIDFPVLKKIHKKQTKVQQSSSTIKREKKESKRSHLYQTCEEERERERSTATFDQQQGGPNSMKVIVSRSFINSGSRAVKKARDTPAACVFLFPAPHTSPSTTANLFHVRGVTMCANVLLYASNMRSHRVSCRNLPRLQHHLRQPCGWFPYLAKVQIHEEDTTSEKEAENDAPSLLKANTDQIK